MKQIVCHGIICVDAQGIILRCQNSDITIQFEECAKNFAYENALNVSKCVATRDITSLSFVFFTEPKTNIVFKKNLMKDLFFGRSAFDKFIELQNAIIKVGYSSYDMS